jgi:TonB family protein
MLTALALFATTWGAEPTLPSVARQVPVAWPEQAVQAAMETGVPQRVLIEVLVRPDGTVGDAAVVEAGSDALGQAALDAIRGFRFTPGTDADGQPTSSVIRYAFTLQPDAAPADSVRGEVREAGVRTPIAGGTVEASRGDDVRITTTGPQGDFRFVGLPDGEWVVSFSAPGFDLVSETVEVRGGRVASLRLSPVRSRPWEAPTDEELVVVGRSDRPEVTERVLSYEEIRYLPGTGGDIVKVVQNLPGVARPPFNIGQLLIRGTAPEDSAYTLDGSQVPQVFHFSGFSTVLANDLVREVSFLPGNYSVRYGRTLGGVVELKTRDELPERSNGYLSVDLFQTAGFVEQKVGANTAVIFALRRSYVDAILNPIFNGIEDGPTFQAPRYADGQARVFHDTGTGSLEALVLFSDDRFRILGEDADQQEQTQIGLTTTFAKARVLSRERLGDDWRNEASLIAGPENQSFAIAPDGEAYERALRVALREELARDARQGAPGVRMGLDVQGGQFTYLYDVPAFGAREEQAASFLLPGVYGEGTLRTGPVQTTAGVRGDYAAYGGAYDTFAVDPRAAVQVGVDSPTVLKASYGRFSQMPTIRQALDQPRLGPQRSDQASVGWEQRWSPAIDTELTGFYNQLDELVVGREDAFRFFSGPPTGGPVDEDPYANDGQGRILGGELLVKAQTDRTVAWVSTTLLRSVRTKRPGQEERLFEYDQPVVVTALASHQLPKRWRLGARTRFSSGNPYTPVVNRTYSLDRRAFEPVYGPADSDRLPPFYSVDVRIDKDWVYDNWTLTAYVDVQNATNAQNIETMSWTYDFAEEDPITSLPVVPAFGLRGEW